MTMRKIPMFSLEMTTFNWLPGTAANLPLVTKSEPNLDINNPPLLLKKLLQQTFPMWLAWALSIPLSPLANPSLPFRSTNPANTHSRQRSLPIHTPSKSL